MANTATVGRSSRTPFRPGTTLELHVESPRASATLRPCRYWEVDVEARTDGVDYGVRFLVAVTERPR